MTIDHLSTIIKTAFPGPVSGAMKLKRTKCSALIKNVLGPESLQEIVADVGDSRYSLILDESTDVATMKFMCICVRYYSPKMKEVLCATLGMVEVPLTTSVILHQELKDFLALFWNSPKKFDRYWDRWSKQHVWWEPFTVHVITR